jgi:hypothetical protein
VLDGEYILYFTSFTPEASGDIKTVGGAEGGVLSGRFERYRPDGSLMVEYAAENDTLIRVYEGSPEDAKDQLKADRVYLDMIVRLVLETPGDVPQEK